MKELLIQRSLILTRLVDHLQPLALLAARLYVSSVFFRSGMVKIADWGSTLALFRDEYTVPVLPPTFAAYLGTFGELFFPVLITLGLAGRFVEPDQPLYCFGQTGFAGRGDGGLTRLELIVSSQQQRQGLGMVFLSGQGFAEH